MPKKLDSLIIADLEASCWEGGKPPVGETQEIIEIGVVRFDLQSWEVDSTSKKSIIVKPLMSKISPYCTQLTSLTQAQVDAGTSLGAACEILTKEYNSRSRPWGSWGDYDRWMFDRDCKRKQIPYPFGARHINLKTLFAIHKSLKREVGMKAALGMMGLKLEGEHHSGMWDAYNIGRILEKQGRF